MAAQPTSNQMAIAPVNGDGPTPDQEEMSKTGGSAPRGWLHGFWDCFSDPATCCFTYCCPCVVYGTVRSTFTGKPDNCVQDGGMFCLAGLCCLAPALGAINRYEMREKYNIIGLHQSETAGVKKHFEGKASNEVLGKKDGHGFITDLVTYYCCGICALCQEKREIDDLVNSGRV